MDKGNTRLFVRLLAVLITIPCVKGQHGNQKPQIYSLRIRTDIKFRFATTLITSRVANPLNYSTEATFDVTLPNDAFISNFTMEIDGQIYQADVDEKEKALARYNVAKRKGQSAGHVSKAPRETNKFKIAVNIEAQGKITFNMTYQELLSRRLGMYTHKVYVNPGQPVDDLRIDVAIQESREITELRVPPIRNDLLTNIDVTAQNDIAVVSQPTPFTAFISYFPNVEQQLEESPDGISGQFLVEYDIDRALDAGDLLVVNGYFVHFFAPDVPASIPKDVMFVLDVSGSMSGTKIQQLIQAMLNILEDFVEGDRFNILAFDHNLYLYKAEMISVTQQSIGWARDYVKSLRSMGGTNINDALLEGIDLLRNTNSTGERAPAIVFLTDGDATSGETDSDIILSNIWFRNRGHIPIFCLAFGYGADWDLLKRIASQTDGIAKKIYQDSDADLQISGFYDELSVTLLKNVSVQYLGEAVSQESITESKFKTYFQGQEFVVAGRLSDEDANVVDLQIFGESLGGAVVLTDPSIPDFSDVTGLTKDSDFKDIVEKTWAYLTIKQLLRKATETENKSLVQGLKDKALALSLKYHFVTPLTSLVITKPDSDEPEADDYDSETGTPTTPAPRRQSSSGRGRGGGGGGGGGYGGGGGGDPHFMIRERGIQHPLCFDLDCHDGEIYRLLQDPNHDVTINAAIIESPKMNIHGKPKTFIGKVAVMLRNHKLVVTPQEIVYNDEVLPWSTDILKNFGNHGVEMNENATIMVIRFTFGPELFINRHVRLENDTERVSFLNAYINKEDGFGKRSSGLLGRFVNTHVKLQLKKVFNSTGGKLVGKFSLTDRLLSSRTTLEPTANKIHHVIRGNLVEVKQVLSNVTEPCWRVHHKFDNLLYGYAKDIRVHDILQR